MKRPTGEERREVREGVEEQEEGEGEGEDLLSQIIDELSEQLWWNLSRQEQL